MLLRRRTSAAGWLLLLVVLAGLAGGASSQAFAIALFSQELRLHLPWVSFQGRLFAVDLDFTDDADGGSFSVVGVVERNGQGPRGGVAVVDGDLSLHIPRLSFSG